jgi:hypothetical protein
MHCVALEGEIICRSITWRACNDPLQMSSMLCIARCCMHPWYAYRSTICNSRLSCSALLRYDSVDVTPFDLKPGTRIHSLPSATLKR